MARGCLYEMKKSENVEGLVDLFTVREQDLYDYSGIEFDYIDHLTDPSKDIEYILDSFKQSGMQTGYEEVEGQLVPYFIIDKISKENYFKPTYDAFMTKAKDLSFDEFVHNSSSIWSLRALLNDQYSDAAVGDFGEFLTLDNFLREANGKYYIGSVFLMH